MWKVHKGRLKRLHKKRAKGYRGLSGSKGKITPTERERERERERKRNNKCKNTELGLGLTTSQP